MKAIKNIFLFVNFFVITSCEESRKLKDDDRDNDKDNHPQARSEISMVKEEEPQIGFKSSEAAKEGMEILSKVNQIIMKAEGNPESTYRSSGQLAHVITVYGIEDELIISKILEMLSIEFTSERFKPIYLEFYERENWRRNTSNTSNTAYRHDELLLCRKIINPR